MRFAIVKDGVVINHVVAESASAMPQVEGCECVEVADGQSIGFGWTWDGRSFNPPMRPIKIKAPSLEDRIDLLEKTVAELLGKQASTPPKGE